MKQTFFKSFLSLLIITFFLAIPFKTALASSPVGIWTPTDSISSPSYDATTTVLQNGKILIAGGQETGTGSLSSAELYDPNSGTWTATGSMNIPRSGHTATLLSNGQVLVAGGFDRDSVSGQGVSSAELYDPNTGTWTLTGSMNTPRELHTATLLPNGEVLVSGGHNNSPTVLSTAELYNPNTGTWTLTGNMNKTRMMHTATLLSNGEVLVAGGFNNYSNHQVLSSAELYNPNTGTWTFTGSMSNGRRFHTATLLSSGEVLVTGGDNSANGTVYSSTELYDPNTGIWTLTGSMNTARTEHTATLLPNGEVLVAGGIDTSINTFFSSAELYDPNTGIWTLTGSMNTARAQHTAALLPNGDVLVAGGSNRFGDIASAELFSLVSNQAPVINFLPNTTVNQNSTYTTNGSFTDADSTSWTATVDYGDGSGVQPLTLSGNNFSLSHVYITSGIKTITVSVTDNQGAKGTQTGTITVNAPPVINPLSNATINQGDVYQASGSFTDSDSTSWTGTVDYGDGSGVQLLSLAGMNFSLNHTYITAGTFPITVLITDNQGATGTQTTTVTANPIPTTKDQCKNDGWKNFPKLSFENQGECIKYVNHS